MCGKVTAIAKLFVSGFWWRAVFLFTKPAFFILVSDMRLFYHDTDQLLVVSLPSALHFHPWKCSACRRKFLAAVVKISSCVCKKVGNPFSVMKGRIVLTIIKCSVASLFHFPIHQSQICIECLTCVRQCDLYVKKSQRHGFGLIHSIHIRHLLD